MQNSLILPFKIELNPPDVFYKDIYDPNFYLYVSDYEVKKIRSPISAIRFSSFYNEEGIDKINTPYTFLFWNRQEFNNELFFVNTENDISYLKFSIFNYNRKKIITNSFFNKKIDASLKTNIFNFNGNRYKINNPYCNIHNVFPIIYKEKVDNSISEVEKINGYIVNDYLKLKVIVFGMFKNKDIIQPTIVNLKGIDLFIKSYSVKYITLNSVTQKNTYTTYIEHKLYINLNYYLFNKYVTILNTTDTSKIMSDFILFKKD